MANHASVALRNGELIGQLRHDALHDALTGLPNRAHLQRRLARRARRGGRGHVPRRRGAASLDLDEFKEVNETFGHQQGDRLLMEVAPGSRASWAATGTVARLGGDEFAVLLPGAVDEDRAVHRRPPPAPRPASEPVALDGHDGGGRRLRRRRAGARPRPTDPASLLKRADLAMSDAKTSSRRVRLYDPELDADKPHNLTLVSELRDRRAAGRRCRCTSSRRPGSAPDGVTGVEALVRWEHPVLGSIGARGVHPDRRAQRADRPA